MLSGFDHKTRNQNKSVMKPELLSLTLLWLWSRSVGSSITKCLLTGNQVIDRPAKKYPPIVLRLDRLEDYERGRWGAGSKTDATGRTADIQIHALDTKQHICSVYLLQHTDCPESECCLTCLAFINNNNIIQSWGFSRSTCIIYFQVLPKSRQQWQPWSRWQSQRCPRRPGPG